MYYQNQGGGEGGDFFLLIFQVKNVIFKTKENFPDLHSNNFLMNLVT